MKPSARRPRPRLPVALALVLLASAAAMAPAAAKHRMADSFTPTGATYGEIDVLPSLGPGHDLREASLAASSVTALGLPYDPTGSRSSGAVHLFERDAEGHFRHAQSLSAPDGAPDGFGNSLARSAAGLVVGAHLAESGSTGAAYVFPHADGRFATVPVRLVPSDGAKDLGFGRAVAAFQAHADMPSERIVVVGAPALVPDATGAVYVFRQQADGTWREEARLVPADGETGTNFGAAVAASDGLVAVSAPGAGVRRGDQELDTSGSVYLFSLNPGGWAQEAKLRPGAGPASSFFGRAIALYDDRLLVGSDLQPPSQAVPAGTATLFRRGAGGTWGEEARLAPVDGEWGEHFGASVALDAGAGAVGGPSGRGGAGAAYLFLLGEGGWGQKARLTPPSDCAAGAGIGRALGFSGPASVLASVYSRTPDDLSAWGHESGPLAQDAVASGLEGGCAGLPIPPGPESSVAILCGQVPVYPAGTRPFEGGNATMRAAASCATDGQGFRLLQASVPPGQSVAALPDPQVELVHRAGILPATLHAEVRVVSGDVADLAAQLAGMGGGAGVPPASLPGALRYVEVAAAPEQKEAPPDSVTVRIAYGEDELVAQGVGADGLALHYWNGGRWVDLLSDVPPDGRVAGATPEHDLRVLAAGLDAAGRVAWATVNHTSVYALAPGHGEAAGGSRLVRYGAASGGDALQLHPAVVAAAIIWALALAVWASVAVLHFRRRRRG